VEAFAEFDIASSPGANSSAESRRQDHAVLDKVTRGEGPGVPKVRRRRPRNGASISCGAVVSIETSRVDSDFTATVHITQTATGNTWDATSGRFTAGSSPFMFSPSLPPGSNQHTEKISILAAALPAGNYTVIASARSLGGTTNKSEYEGHFTVFKPGE